jgi:polysaccharide deacetylase family protein (PEP-CTERM system associated)
VSNVLTFDVEDWFHGLEPRAAVRARWGSRLCWGMGAILDLLAEADVHATFFVLGCVAEQQPEIVRAIVAGGHEVGTHGWSHTPIFNQTRVEFRSELQHSLGVLGDITGEPIVAHRAAYFSIRADTLWALDELLEAGVRYDASILPAFHYRAGMPRAPRLPFRVNGGPLVEFPVSTLRCGPLNVPFSGGLYVRALPYAVLRRAFGRLSADGVPAIAYFHPWEFDLAHPRVRLSASWLTHKSHYHALATAEPKLRALLSEFSWSPLGSVLREHGLAD